MGLHYPIALLYAPSVLPRFSLRGYLCSLIAPSTAALLPFPKQNGNLESQVRGVYDIWSNIAWLVGFGISGITMFHLEIVILTQM